MRYLAIDLGDKRTGLAAGDDETGIVSPLEVIEAPRGELLLAALIKAVNAHQPGAIIVGLPINMDGSEGLAARIAREFGEQLRQKTRLPLHFQDERLTSFAADDRMSQTGRTHKQKKKLRDALAAAEVLNDFLSSRQAGDDGAV